MALPSGGSILWPGTDTGCPWLRTAHHTAVARPVLRARHWRCWREGDFRCWSACLRRIIRKAALVHDYTYQNGSCASSWLWLLVRPLACWCSYWLQPRSSRCLERSRRGISCRWWLTEFFFFFWFGWPLALVITAAVAVPAFHFLRRRGWLTAGRVLMIGTVAGGIIIPLVWAALWGISDVTDPIELLKGC